MKFGQEIKPNTKSGHRKLRRISRDVVFGLLLIVLSAASLVILVNYFMGAYKADHRLNKEADQYMDYLSKSISMSIWSFDINSARQIGDAFMESEQVVLLEIAGDAGELFYSKKKEITGDVVLRESDLKYQDEVIGTVRFGLSRQPYLRELRRVISSILMVTAVITTVMVAACLWMLDRIVNKPLKLLMNFAAQMAKGKYDSQIENITSHEITVVYDQLRIMAGRIKGREASLSTANAQLKKEIEHHQNTQREVRDIRNYLSNIVDSMPSLIIGVDLDGKVIQWNRTAARSSGISSKAAIGRIVSDLLPQMSLELSTIRKSIHTRQVVADQKRPRICAKGTCYEDITIYPLITEGVEGAVIRIDDVTEKVRIEEMMIQTEKMLSIGGLAAGMAHEINNPMAGMMQTASVLSKRLTASARIPANLKAAEAAGTSMEAIERFMEARGVLNMLSVITESGNRVATIVGNMLSFARKSDSTISPYAMEELVEQTLELAATDYDLKKQYDFKLIAIKKEYGQNIPTVPCEKAKIQQVLLNIFRNGAQAMLEKGVENPRLVIRTRFNKERQMVCLEVEDNGPGMDTVARKRVFEPFFTTKPPGMGTGLGMSVSYFIITENHGGEMTVESRPGAGAMFVVNLPVAGHKS